MRTYSGALNKYRDETIEYKPLRMSPADTDVTVRTAVMKPGGAPIQIDYSMAKKPAGWKAYDVIVGGVSLVTNYRDEFNEQIKSGGVDGLIKTLADKNKGAAGEVIAELLGAAPRRAARRCFARARTAPAGARAARSRSPTPARCSRGARAAAAGDGRRRVRRHRGRRFGGGRAAARAQAPRAPSAARR